MRRRQKGVGVGDRRGREKTGGVGSWRQSKEKTRGGRSWRHKRGRRRQKGEGVGDK